MSGDKNKNGRDGSVISSTGGTRREVIRAIPAAAAGAGAILSAVLAGAAAAQPPSESPDVRRDAPANYRTPVIDAFVHVHDQDYHDAAQPALTAEDQMLAMEAVGVDATLIVAAVLGVTGQGADYALSVAKRYPDKFAVITPVDLSGSDVEAYIEAFASSPGGAGLRMRINQPDHPNVARILAKAAQLDLPVCLSGVNGGVALKFDPTTVFARFAKEHPKVRFALHHMGMRQPYDSTPDPNAFAALPSILALARYPNMSVMVTGAASMSVKGFPFEDTWDPLKRLIQAFGVERCMWGTNWTRTLQNARYGDAVASVRYLMPLSVTERAALMGGSLKSFLKWTPKIGRT